MRQVLANLFENCIRYCGRGSSVVLSARIAGTDAELQLDDNGPGVPEQALSHLGERFYRVEGSRSREHGGAGLGLALCRRIIEAHSGTLLFAASPSGGLQVRVRLPVVLP
jgi:two-component system sensor histidine kinase BaeS